MKRFFPVSPLITMISKQSRRPNNGELLDGKATFSLMCHRDGLCSLQLVRPDAYTSSSSWPVAITKYFYHNAFS